MTLTGTRSGAAVASAVAAMAELRPDGYREQYHVSLANAYRLAADLEEGELDVVPPTLPIVAADLGGDLIADLREREWRVSKTEAGEARLVCMPHVTRPMLREFLEDVDDRR